MAVATATHPGSKHNVQVARQAYYDKISKFHMAPLWEVLKDLVTPEPKTECRPAMWKFSDVKKLMMEAGDVISAEEAERRVLVLENPVRPVRHASPIRCSPASSSFCLARSPTCISTLPPRSASCSTAKAPIPRSRAKTMMSHGDFIITANWAPHDHGNPGKQPVMWLDVLDLPTINHFETSFAAHPDEKMQKTSHADGDSFDRYASGVLPDGAPANLNRSPVINYPYAKMRPILERLKKTGDIDKRHGARVRYANPINGGPVLPTMGAYLSLLPKGFAGEPYRSTDGTIFAVAEGQGTTIIDGTPFEWGVNDVFVVPPWKRYFHNAASEAVLFSISDRPAQESLGIWREGN